MRPPENITRARAAVAEWNPKARRTMRATRWLRLWRAAARESHLEACRSWCPSLTAPSSERTPAARKPFSRPRTRLSPIRPAPGPSGPDARSRRTLQSSPRPAPTGVAGWDPSTPGRSRPRRRLVMHPRHQLRLVPGSQDDLPVDAHRQTASVALRHPPHAEQRVRARAEHQLLQVADTSGVPCLRCCEDPLTQPPYVVLDRTPIDRVPVEHLALGSVHVAAAISRTGCRLRRRVQLVRRFQRRCHVLSTSSPAPVSPLSGRASALSGQLFRGRAGGSRRMRACGFLSPFSEPAFGSGASFAR